MYFFYNKMKNRKMDVAITISSSFFLKVQRTLRNPLSFLTNSGTRTYLFSDKKLDFNFNSLCRQLGLES